MKKTCIITILVLALVAFTGCMTTLPIAATGNAVGSKTGVASEFWLFGAPPLSFVFPGQGGVANAAKAGKITKISTVDVKYEWYFVFANVKTIVTGE